MVAGAAALEVNMWRQALEDAGAATGGGQGAAAAAGQGSAAAGWRRGGHAPLWVEERKGAVAAVGRTGA